MGRHGGGVLRRLQQLGALVAGDPHPGMHLFDFADGALFEQACKVSWDDYFPLLRYQILSNPALTTIYQVNQEMAVRIKDAIKTAQTVDELVEAVATKRYTKARVRRLLTYILVQARESD